MPTSAPLPDAHTSVKLVQITDSHLFENTRDVLVGMNCEEGMRDVVELIRQQEGALAAVLCTGDISQDHSSASYLRYLQAIATLAAPQYWIAGNHDELPKMREAVGADNPCFEPAFDVGHWRVIMLNSNVPGEVYGALEQSELDFLHQQLEACRERSALVCLHHNCVPVQAAWLQPHALTNAAALFAVLDRFTHVKAVLFGHIHQELVHERRKVLYLGAPSTCIQFHPYKNTFALDNANPGYRWLQLFSNGELRTGVKRVTHKSYPVDFSGIGY